MKRLLGVLIAIALIAGLTAVAVMRAPRPDPVVAAVPHRPTAQPSGRPIAAKPATDPDDTDPVGNAFARQYGQAASIPDKAERRRRMLDVYVRWSAEPEAALDPRFRELKLEVAELLVDWAREDPDAAAAWLATRPDLEARQLVSPTQFAQAASLGMVERGEFDRAVRYVSASPWDGQSPAAIALAQSWMPRDATRALEWIQSLESSDPDLWRTVARAAGRGLSTGPTGRTLEIIAAQPEPLAVNLIGGLSEVLALSTLTNRSADLIALARLADQRSDGAKDAVRREIALALRREDVDAAVRLALQQSDRAARDGLLAELSNAATNGGSPASLANAARIAQAIEDPARRSEIEQNLARLEELQRLAE